MVSQCDRHQRQNEEARDSRGGAVADGDRDQPGEDPIAHDEQSGEADQANCSRDRELEIRAAGCHGIERGLDGGPRWRRHEPIEGHGGEKQQNEHDHRGCHGLTAEEAACRRAQVQLAISLGGPDEALEAVHASAPRSPHQAPVQRRHHLGLLTRSSTGANRANRPKTLAKGSPAGQPYCAAIDGHAGPGDERVRNDQQRELGRHRSPGEHEPNPSECAEEQDGRPHPERRRIHETPFEANGALDDGEQRTPWIEDHPYVAKQRREIRDAHPPDNPYGRRRQIAGGILTAEGAGGNDQRQQSYRHDPAGPPQPRIDEDPGHPPAQEIDPRIAFDDRRVPYKQADDDERENDRDRSAADQSDSGTGRS